MSAELWKKVDTYLEGVLVREDDVFTAALRDSENAGLPSIAVSPSQGKLLGLLVQSLGARQVLELGTLGGYSSLWLARALPEGGKLTTLELEPKHAEVARKNLERGGVAGRVQIRVGPASASLTSLKSEGAGPFDLIFIDADKESLAEYFTKSLALARVGTLIVVDNVIRRGDVANPESTDPRVLGVRKLNDAIAAEPRVSATAIQTVGAKGYDGLTFALVIR
ncbi:MAG: O-methyltransferase [Polyangiales bacterium]